MTAISFTLEVGALVDIAGEGLHRVVGVGYDPTDNDETVPVAFLRIDRDSELHAIRLAPTSG